MLNANILNEFKKMTYYSLFELHETISLKIKCFHKYKKNESYLLKSANSLTFSQQIHPVELLNNQSICCVPPQRVSGTESSTHFKPPPGMQSGGEEEQEDEAHPPLPPPMEIIKDPSAQDDKVRHICFWSDGL